MRHSSFRCRRAHARIGGLLLACAALPTAIAAAQVQDRPVDSRERMLQAVRAEGPITIDGRLDEAAWQRATPATGLIQIEPFEGEPALEDAEVRVLYDADNLYIGARLYDSRPESIARQLTRRGETGQATDYFEFALDPNRDRTTGYRFRVTAAGVQWDAYLFNDTGADSSWEAVWESAVSIDDAGWVAEIRLPLSQLRHEGSNTGRVWGVNFARRRVADNERSEWAWTPSGTPGTVSRFGQLQGLMLEPRGRHIELLPYVMSGWQRAPAEPNDPFFSGSALRSRIGADLRYSLGATFVADVALNPDFGQVEVDPQVINLGAFETFFPERRPFFSRDDRLFQHALGGPQSQLVHSRRIGRSPQGRAPAGADFVSIPGETTILGAGKITGRTPSGLNLGVLAAVTERERGRAYYEDGDEVVRFDAEPRSHYGIVRMQQDLNEAQSRVGGMLTIVDRSLPADGTLDFLTRQAFAGMFDFEHSWGDREWRAAGHVVGSHVRGSEEAMLRVQRSPIHYHQRPDQDYKPLDPNVTSMSGLEWEAEINRRSRHWNHRVWIGERTRGFEVNDLGYYAEGQRVILGVNTQYREPAPASPWLQSYSVLFRTVNNWRHTALDRPLSASGWTAAHRYSYFQSTADFTFHNWWGLRLNTRIEPHLISDELTRGGPLMQDPGMREISVRVNTDQRDEITWDASAGYTHGLRGGGRFNAGVGVDARPTDRLRMSANLSYDRRRDVRQYVTQVADAGYADTYGRRYLFSDVEREQLSLNLRANVIFSPTLSLEAFVQPLIAAADFTTYKQLTTPGRFEFLHFSEGQASTAGGQTVCLGGTYCRSGEQVHIDFTGDGFPNTAFREQNFNIRSLRGSAVLRWEYMPGSRLYLVWQHRRQDRVPLGSLSLSRDGRALLEGDGEHMFMIKIDRWFNL